MQSLFLNIFLSVIQTLLESVKVALINSFPDFLKVLRVFARTLAVLSLIVCWCSNLCMVYLKLFYNILCITSNLEFSGGAYMCAKGSY